MASEIRTLASGQFLTPALSLPRPTLVAWSCSHVRVDFAPSFADRNRLTIFFRIVLVILHVAVLYLIYLAALIAYVIARFAGLFTGQWPAGPQNFVLGLMRWGTRLNAFGLTAVMRFTCSPIRSGFGLDVSETRSGFKACGRRPASRARSVAMLCPADCPPAVQNRSCVRPQPGGRRSASRREDAKPRTRARPRQPMLRAGPRCSLRSRAW